MNMGEGILRVVIRGAQYMGEGVIKFFHYMGVGVI